jgi:hypothetical protein
MARCWPSIVVISLSLLALATSVSAECAWVLWGRPLGIYETTEGIGEDGAPKGRFVPTKRGNFDMPDPWIERAYTTAEECQREVTRVQPSSPRPAGSHLVKRFSVSDGTQVWVSANFMCLPDTVDPRGPKGTK